MWFYWAAILYNFPLRRHTHFKNKLGKHWHECVFVFFNGISTGVVHTDQMLYTYYYLQIINICVLMLLGWLHMNTEALVLLITNTMLAGSRKAFVNTPWKGLKELRKHPAESLPILLRKLVLILSSPIRKAAKVRAGRTALHSWR